MRSPLHANETSVPFAPGTGTELLASGVQAPLAAIDASQPRQIDFDIALLLTGTGEFNLTPAGRDTHVRLKSDWPHPSFIGKFLPRTRAVTEQASPPNGRPLSSPPTSKKNWPVALLRCEVRGFPGHALSA